MFYLIISVCLLSTAMLPKKCKYEDENIGFKTE
jgi:hypothetical protein